jgi:predicted metal-binding protein
MVRKVEKINLDIDEDKLKKRLEHYREKAIELGASKAKVIPTEEIPVDERVTLKCQVPRCFGYGVCAHCPPNALKPSELEMHLKKYKWAIFFTIDFPSEVLVRDKATIKERVAAYEKVYKIVSEVESAAFFDGYYLAFGFAAGSCRHVFCGLEKNCLAMEGQRCRFSLRARPSMEAVGIDVYRMVAQAGWDIYPMATNMEASEVPKGTLAGIVIIY